MQFNYTSLADSVSDNPLNKSVSRKKRKSKDGTENQKKRILQKRRAEALLKEFEEIENSKDKALIFTLPQIVDNPIFFYSTDDKVLGTISKSLWDKLITLLLNKKAFISTFEYIDSESKETKRHTLNTYALKRMISSFLRFYEGEDNVSYVPSVIEELAKLGKLKNGKMVYDERDKRQAHEILFGTSKCVTINDGKVKYHDGKEIPIDEYVKNVLNEAESPYGYYTGLAKGVDEGKDDIRLVEKCNGNYLSRMKGLCDAAKKVNYKLNNSYLLKHCITYGDIFRRILKNKTIFQEIYNKTADRTLIRRLNEIEKEDIFIKSVKEEFEKLLDRGVSTRSQMYVEVRGLIEILEPILDYSEGHVDHNSRKRICESFLFQVIDFVQNYYYSLLARGAVDCTLKYYPYYTVCGEIPEDLKIDKNNCISIRNSRIRDGHYYFVFDSQDKLLGKYTGFKEAREKTDQSGVGSYIEDFNGDMIYPLIGCKYTVVFQKKLEDKNKTVGEEGAEEKPKVFDHYEEAYARLENLGSRYCIIDSNGDKIYLKK